MVRFRDVYFETEQSLLAVLWHGWPQAQDLLGLPPTFFADATHRAIYERLVTCYRDGLPVDAKVIARQLLERGCPIEAIDDTRNAEVTAESVPDYLEALVKRTKIARVMQFAGAVQGGEDNAAITRDAYAMLADLDASDGYAVPKMHSLLVSEQSHTFFTRRPPTIATGLTRVDKLFGNGLRRKELTILAGEAGSGKSAIMGLVSHHVALSEAQGHVLYISKEMDTRSIMFRIYASLSGVSATRFDEWHEHRLEGKTLTDEEQRQYDRFLDAYNTLDALPDYVFHTIDLERRSRITPEMIAAEVRAINAAAGDDLTQRVALVVVDYLQLLDYPRGKGFNESTELENVAYGLKNLAMSEGCHVICASSMNRDTGASEMNRLRNSGGVQFAADNVLMLTGHRDLAFTGTLAERYGGATLISLYTAKMRNGQPGNAIFLKFTTAIQRITDVAKEDYGAIFDAIKEKESEKKDHR